MYKKIISFILIIASSFGFLTACVSTPEGDTVLVKDANGEEVKIPVNPQRIVDLSGNSDTLVSFGYNVVGTANSDAYDYTKLPDYLKDRLSSAKIVGYSMQDTADIEAIVELKPDLIIISTFQEKIYDQLKKIAPTIMVDLNDMDWRKNLEVIANVFSKQEILKKWLEDYDAKAKQKGEEIKSKYGKDTSYLTVLASGGQLFALGSAGIGQVMYDDMGLKKPDNMPVQDSISLPVISFEGMASLNPDYCIIVGSDNDIENVKNNPIYKNMESVKNKNAIELPSSPYFDMGYNPTGRSVFLDNVVSLMIDNRIK